MGNKLSETQLFLLKTLSDGDFHDGETLGKALGLTRAAVWKSLKSLMDVCSLPLEAVKGKGYRLISPLVLLNETEIQKTVPHIPLHVFPFISSTNDFLQDKKGLNICLAEMQTKGRGRFQRTWHSPFGQNIYCSLSYPFQKDIHELSGLSLVLGLAVCKVLAPLIPVQLKWPNDIWCKGKKLGGILVELNAESHGACQGIIGVGLNINMEQGPIDQPWTSLFKEMGHFYDRNTLVQSLIEHMLAYLQRFEGEGLTPFRDEWRSYDLLQGMPIVLQRGGESLKGIAQGIDGRGCLLLQTSAGEIISLSSGEVSLHKDSFQ